jgi:protoporphyrinogen oxidase
MERIGIIGGGTLGLTLALRLAEAGHRPVVLERAPQLGGLATWFDYGDFVWDRFYHVICRSDDCLTGLIRDLGIEDRLLWRQTLTGFLWRGRHLSMSNNLEFLRFPALNAIEKARLAAGLIYCRRFGDPARLERIRASAWMEGIFGRRVYRAIWEPLLESKYGVLRDEIPATIMWATIRRYASTQQSGGRQALGCLRGGLKTLFDALEQAIARRGGEIHCATAVDALEREPDGAIVARAGERRFVFDRLVGTIPSALLARLAPQWPELHRPPAARPRFLGIVCLALVLSRSLSPYYITNLIQRGFPFAGIIEVSNLAGTDQLAGHHLVMLPRYDVAESEWFETGDDEVYRAFSKPLAEVWPDWERHCLARFVQREKLVQALWIDAPPVLGHAPRTADGRVWNVNAELAGRDTLNNNAIVRVAEAHARELIRAMAEPAAERAHLVTAS